VKDKVEVLVEPAGLVVLGVNGKGSNSGNLRSLNSAQHGVFQESGPKPRPWNDTAIARRASSMMGTGCRARPLVKRRGASS